MRTNLGKLSTFASVLFLSLVIAGCGGTRDDENGMSSMSGDDAGGRNEGGGGGMTGGGAGGDGMTGGGAGGGGMTGGRVGGGGMTGGGVGSDGVAASGRSAPPSAGHAASSESSDAVAGAATATPGFGSVTQSTNTNNDGETTDRASATFTDDPQGAPRLVVSVTQSGQSTIEIDTGSGVGNALDSYTSPIEGRMNAYAVPLHLSNTALTLATVDVGWSSSDATDYVAMGAWVHATGDVLNGEVTSASIGAFVDGPEIRSAPTLPLAGTATYSGPAEGMYAVEYGTDGVSVPEGSYEIGFFLGDTTLTADFGANHISGMVDGIYLVGVTVTPNGDAETFDVLSDYEFHMGATSLVADGTFTGTDVMLHHPGLSFDSNAGSWGGRFSTKEDSEGNPRLVAGTAGGSATTSGGSTASFVGAFVGTTEHFE